MRRRQTPDELADRLPPGQYLETGLPGSDRRPHPGRPHRRVELPDRRHGRRADASGAGTSSTQLPFETIPCDIHCVTKWSKLDTSFGGVSVDVLLEQVEPLDAYAMVYSYGGYTTNLAIEDLTDGKAWVVTEYEGEPLPREHGGPARLLVPHLYFWKSAKWVHGHARDGPRRARLLGGERLPQPRRSLEGGALLDATDGAVPPSSSASRAAGRSGPSAQIKVETPRVKSFRIELPMWMPHLPGQHYDVRLTAPDGYHAERSYSIASSPLDEGGIELTIDRLEDGEVSPYFHDVVVEGDQVEVRGPFASYFVWRGEKPVLLIGGGSGVVPLMCMLRHRRRTMPDLPDAPRLLGRDTPTT